MPNTYTKIHIHIVFAVKYRRKLINKSFQEELHRFITGVVQKRNHKMLAINSMPDHMHIFIGYEPDQSLSDLVRDIKSGSSKFINENLLTIRKFKWQEGYAAFSYARSQIDTVAKYIQNQENHHRKKTFEEEYIEALKKFGVEYNEKYLFDSIAP